MPSRIAGGLRVSMESSTESLGAAGSKRFELPLTSKVRVAATLSVVSTSETVRVPEVVSAALVSERAAVSGPALIRGASLLPVMVMVMVSLSESGLPSSSEAVTV